MSGSPASRLHLGVKACVGCSETCLVCQSSRPRETTSGGVLSTSGWDLGPEGPGAISPVTHCCPEGGPGALFLPQGQQCGGHGRSAGPAEESDGARGGAAGAHGAWPWRRSQGCRAWPKHQKFLPYHCGSVSGESFSLAPAWSSHSLPLCSGKHRLCLPLPRMRSCAIRSLPVASSL